MLIDEFRIVRYPHQSFNNWAVKLEKKQHYSFLFWKWTRWEKVFDNPFSDEVPDLWRAYNIVNEFTDFKLRTC